ncbi:MAG TPA: LacI family DNA-binding transcriptional regulator [Lacipirellulaceae bacterium]|jgi:DNA-binding LacI/PurR family transcriptional regulator
MSTIRKVAKRAGVSIATVSRVVNGSSSVAPELRERVLEAVSCCGYAPTVGRRSEASIALVYAGPFSVGSPYDAACLDGMVTAMIETEFDLKIIHLRRDKSPDETFSQFFMRKGIRGAIVRTTSADRDVAKAIAAEDFPSVVLGDHFDDPRLAFAFNDSRGASFEGIEHLISLGHRRIAFASNETEDGDHIDRRDAYRGALMAHKLFDERLVFRVPARRLDGAQMMRKIMSLSTPPTAVFIADPLTAEGAINEAHKIGVRIPEDLSILGFDDTDTRHSVFPSMTAVCQDSCELGRLAYDALVKRCAAKSTAIDSISGKAWLEINHTTGRAPERQIRILPNGDRLEAIGA